MPSPYPELPLPLRVADLDITGGIPVLEGCEGYGGIRLLLRRRGGPLGWVTMAGNRATVQPEEIERILLRRLRGHNLRQ